MAWVSRTALIAAALTLVATRGAAEFSYEPGERSDPWEQSSISSDPHWLVDQRTGCWAYDSNAGASDTISWSGDCPFGRADGHGTLTFYDRGRMFERLTGNFDAGMLEDGRVSITWADGSHYDGQEKNGQFNGYGVLTNADGTRYDGMWRDDKFADAGDRYGRDDVVAGASGSTAGAANGSAPRDQQAASPDGNGNANHAATNTQQADNGLPPADQIPFRMSTAPVKPQALAKPKSSAPTAPSAPADKWAFLTGKHARLVAADGSKLSLRVADGALARELKRPDGSVAKDSLVFLSDKSGAVRDERGDAIATFQLRDHGIAIDYSDGGTEIVSSSSTGLTTTAQIKDSPAIQTRWYREGHKFSRAERRKAIRQLAMRLAAEKLAAAKAERAAKPEMRVAAQDPPRRVVKTDPPRVAQAPPPNDRSTPAPVVRRAILPIPKPEAIAAATDLPTPELKPVLHIVERLHKRHVEPPVRVAAAEPPPPTPPQLEAHERKPSVSEARREASAQVKHPSTPPTPSPAPPVHEAQTAAAHTSTAHEVSPRPAVANEIHVAKAHEPQVHEPPAHEPATAPQTPVTRPAPPVVSPPAAHVATTATPAPTTPSTAHIVKTIAPAPAFRVATALPQPQAPAHVAPAPSVSAHVATQATRTPPPPPTVPTAAPTPPTTPPGLVAKAAAPTPSAVRAAVPTPPTPPAVHVATATVQTPPPVRATAPAPPPVHVAKAVAQTPPAVHVATTPASPAVHVATTTPPTAPAAAHVAAPAALAPVVAHATTPPPATQAVAHVTAPALPTPAVDHAAAPPPPPAAHVAAVLPPPTHTLMPQTSAPVASRKNASECLSLVSNGTHWGFRNNCDNDIQFAYCIMNGTDRLTACGNSAVPGSVAGHGFTSLVADVSIRDGGANRSFRWVGCNGGAGEVVPRLDRADPPMGRCLHTTDLPQGTERADAGRKLAK